MAKGEKKWVPLESNPEVLNEFAAQLGLSTQVCSVHCISLALIDTFRYDMHVSGAAAGL